MSERSAGIADRVGEACYGTREAVGRKKAEGSQVRSQEGGSPPSFFSPTANFPTTHPPKVPIFKLLPVLSLAFEIKHHQLINRFISTYFAAREGRPPPG